MKGDMGGAAAELAAKAAIQLNVPTPFQLFYVWRKRR